MESVNWGSTERVLGKGNTVGEWPGRRTWHRDGAKAGLKPGGGGAAPRTAKPAVGAGVAHTGQRGPPLSEGCGAARATHATGAQRTSPRPTPPTFTDSARRRENQPPGPPARAGSLKAFFSSLTGLQKHAGLFSLFFSIFQF